MLKGLFIRNKYKYQNKFPYVFSGEEWAHSWQPKDSLQINEK